MKNLTCKKSVTVGDATVKREAWNPLKDKAKITQGEEKLDIQKDILDQYTNIKKELSDLEIMINETNKKIRICEKRVVSDTVVGSRADLTIGTIKINGIAQQELDELNELNLKRIEKMIVFQKKLEKVMVDLEEYIESIPDSEIRRIIRFRYISNLSWNQVARRMGPGYMEDACRKKLNRFLGGK